MCGIAGIMLRDGAVLAMPPVEVARAMATRIAHRGPDDQGVFERADGRIALAHRRLSIIDLSDASHQPMIDPASGVVLVFNGEIYNFRTLRRELETLGYRFLTTGDTEVLLAAYLAWGERCVEHLAGMFAFALWDPRSGTLHLARDAMGIKPLYLTARAEGVAFASEVKAFAALPGFVAQPDPVGIGQFLEFGYVWAGNGTSLAGVTKLLPGEWVRVEGGRIASRRTWFQPSLEPVAQTIEERTETFAALFSEVVDEHLIADVPVGLLLSGGLDSSLVAALAARRGPLTTVCMAFSDSTVDERPHARTVAEHIGARHLEVVITPEEVKREILAGAWVFDDLFADWGTITTRILYRRCRALGLKVVLVGEGSDELFGGYDIFRTSISGPLGLFRLYRRYAGRRWGQGFRPFARVMRQYLAAVGGDGFSAIRLFESRRQLPNQYVMKVDKASMAESVEARTPFLDRRVAEFAYATPASALLTAGENKHLLRRLARTRGLLPAATVARPKFGAPLAADWMDSDPAFRAFARGCILRAGGETDRLGLREPMRDYFERGRSGQRWPGPLSIYRNLAWRLLLLEQWAVANEGLSA